MRPWKLILSISVANLSWLKFFPSPIPFQSTKSKSGLIDNWTGWISLPSGPLIGTLLSITQTFLTKHLKLRALPSLLHRQPFRQPEELDRCVHGNATALQTSLLSSYLDVGLTFYNDGGNGDAAVAYSTPIFQMAEAISSMKDIKAMGEKAKEEAKRNLIFKILTMVLMVIPFVGEALGPMAGSVAVVARIALLIGEGGNAALTVADIIKDPTSAPFAILGLIAGGVGAGAGRATALQKASSASGLLKDSDWPSFHRGLAV